MIEVTIVHMETHGRLDHSFFLGHVGDAINALLVAAGHNLRLVLKALMSWPAYFLYKFRTEAANRDTFSILVDRAKSTA
jgi:IS5 family transposase